MDIKWLMAVIDLPHDVHDVGGDFWAQVSKTTKGEIHPEHPEYCHLNPAVGDMVLELQRVDEGVPAVHLDLVVDDVLGVSERALELGARHVSGTAKTHQVLTTPAGVTFCVVPWSGEAERPEVIDPASPHAVDQICIDVPHGGFDDDIAFWEQLTGWPQNSRTLSEFQSFDQPEHLPLRLLIQQLGVDDTGGPRAHLDLAAGSHVASVVERHVAAGATVLDQRELWTALSDPSGAHYCVTSRTPRTG